VNEELILYQFYSQANYIQKQVNTISTKNKTKRHKHRTFDQQTKAPSVLYSNPYRDTELQNRFSPPVINRWTAIHGTIRDLH